MSHFIFPYYQNVMLFTMNSNLSKSACFDSIEDDRNMQLHGNSCAVVICCHQQKPL